MAHLVETMAYRKRDEADTPWHGLGEPIHEEQTPEEILVTSGCDWEVNKIPLYVPAFVGEGFDEIEDRFALRRSVDGRVLDVVGKLYVPTQNRDAFKFFTEFVRAGDMTMETAGSLDAGRRVWALASIRKGFVLAGGDEVDGYLLLCSPHKQGEALTVRFTGIRVVCNNTLTTALNGQSIATFRMAHLTAFDEQMQKKAREALGLATQRLSDLAEKAEFLSESKVTSSADLLRYIVEVSGTKILDEEPETDEDREEVNLAAVIEATEDVAVAKKAREVTEDDLNRMGKAILESICDSPGSDLEAARGTWWGAFSGVTHAIDHKIGRTADTRMNAAWFGNRANVKSKALELATVYAIGEGNG